MVPVKTHTRKRSGCIPSFLLGHRKEQWLASGLSSSLVYLHALWFLSCSPAHPKATVHTNTNGRKSKKEQEKATEDNTDPSSLECDLSGIWLNARGMQLRISTGVHKEQLMETITVPSADVYGCYHVHGSYLNNSCIISFSSSWTNDLSGNSKSITSWTGQMMDGALHMTHMTVSHTPVKFAAWLQFINGYDVFVRQSQNSGNEEAGQINERAWFLFCIRDTSMHG